MNLAACFLHVNKMQIRIVQGRNQMQVQQGQDLLLPEEGRGVRSKRACCPNRPDWKEKSTPAGGDVLTECSHHDGTTEERAAAL
jgi:hypothetical protein